MVEIIYCYIIGWKDNKTDDTLKYIVKRIVIIHDDNSAVEWGVLYRKVSPLV